MKNISTALFILCGKSFIFLCLGLFLVLHVHTLGFPFQTFVGESSDGKNFLMQTCDATVKQNEKTFSFSGYW